MKSVAMQKITRPCGCWSDGVDLQFCSLQASAPELKVALKELLAFAGDRLDPHTAKAIAMGRNAIACAERDKRPIQCPTSRADRDF